MKYSSTRYLWPEKNLEKIEKKSNDEVETLSFNEDEFIKLVLPLINKIMNEKDNTINKTEKDLLNKIKNEQESILKSIQNPHLPPWVFISLSVCFTSIFFLVLLLLIKK
jgi:hypothetical protein